MIHPNKPLIVVLGGKGYVKGEVVVYPLLKKA
jgi:hypothetical protein